jgi:hypothetical protein
MDSICWVGVELSYFKGLQLNYGSVVRRSSQGIHKEDYVTAGQVDGWWKDFEARRSHHKQRHGRTCGKMAVRCISPEFPTPPSRRMLLKELQIQIFNKSSKSKSSKKSVDKENAAPE